MNEELNVKIELDFKDIKNKKMLHEYLRVQLGLPDYYGNNLDALHDCLEACGNIFSIRIYHFSDLKKEMGEYAEILLQVFKDIDLEYEIV